MHCTAQKALEVLGPLSSSKPRHMTESAYTGSAAPCAKFRLYSRLAETAPCRQAARTWQPNVVTVEEGVQAVVDVGDVVLYVDLHTNQT